MIILYSKLMKSVTSLHGGFQYDLMMTLDSGLLFWPRCMTPQ